MSQTSNQTLKPAFRRGHILSKFTRRGTGTKILVEFQKLLLDLGFHSIVADCKAYDRPLAEKEKLAQWYEKLGFSLTRNFRENDPGYIGELSKNLKSRE